MNDTMTLDVLRAGVQMMVSDALGRRLAHEVERDASLRATVHHFETYFASRKIAEDEQVFTRTLSWRERLRVLFNGQVTYRHNVTLRRNCPHLDIEPPEDHRRWLAR